MVSQDNLITFELFLWAYRPIRKHLLERLGTRELDRGGGESCSYLIANAQAYDDLQVSNRNSPVPAKMLKELAICLS